MFYNAKNEKIDIDNTTVNYISFGKGKRNLIIIPGLGDGFKTVKGLAVPFAFMYKLFAKDFRVYVFSRRNNIKEGFSIEDMANDIIKHMERLKIDKADVVGVSQGGMIAQYIAINAPKKINKLVLAVTVSKTNEIMEEVITDWIEKAKNKDYKGIMVDNVEKSYTGSYLEKNRKLFAFLGLLGKNASFDRFIIQAKSCLEHNVYDKLEEIICPTLVIGAKKDKVLGVKGSEEMVEKIPNSELYIYEEYSHGVYEQAKDFNSRILEYLKQN